MLNNSCDSMDISDCSSLGGSLGYGLPASLKKKGEVSPAPSPSAGINSKLPLSPILNTPIVSSSPTMRTTDEPVPVCNPVVLAQICAKFYPSDLPAHISPPARSRRKSLPCAQDQLQQRPISKSPMPTMIAPL